ncbi:MULTISPECIES: hypothetical protein [unclassified Rhizobium]|uniref:hypothetical protein n=1 Tax=unclassified Rhizobium TaxID=2613769 RepID=UPI00190FF4E2|nr:MULTISPECIES: hypothetical protein [unclassified Rhizobium]
MNAEDKRARKSLDIQLFAKQIGRKAHAGHDPNDRQYDRGIAQKLRRMSPEEIDSLLRGEDE